MRTLSLLLFFVIVHTTLAQAQEPMKNFDSNFVHSVYFWLKNPENTEDRKAFETSLSTFLNNSKFAKTNFLGTPPKAVRDVVDDSFTYNLIVTFASAEAQEGYQNEAAHLKFIEESKHLWTKVIVYDALGLDE